MAVGRSGREAGRARGCPVFPRADLANTIRGSAWADTWQLTLAVEKTIHLRVGLCKSSPDAQYYLNGSTLRTVDDVRDLGILVDANMCFKAHINLIVAKAHLRANQIIRCFLSRDIESLTRAFVSG